MLLFIYSKAATALFVTAQNQRLLFKLLFPQFQDPSPTALLLVLILLPGCRQPSATLTHTPLNCNAVFQAVSSIFKVILSDS